MKILITTRNYLPVLGGTVVYTQMFAQMFRQLGHTVVISTRTAGEEVEGDGSLRVLRRPGYRELLRETESSDILLQVEPSIQDLIPALVSGTPVVATLHVGGSLEGLPLRGKLLRTAQRLLLPFLHPVGVSRYVLASWGSRGRSILNPYRPEIFFPPPEDLARPIDFLFVGRITEDKGVPLLLEVLQQPAFSNCRSSIVGDGEVAEVLQTKARQLQLSGVEFRGRLSPQEVAEEMRRSKVLIFPTLPTWLEASPLTLIEALACGCQVIGSDVGGVRETGGGFIKLVPAGDAAALGEAMSEFLQNGSVDVKFEGDLKAFLKGRELKSVATEYLSYFEEVVSKSK